MSDALAIAASGLKTQEYYLDKLANDLANLNTANYKASHLTFADVLYQNIAGINPRWLQRPSATLGLGVAVYQTAKDFSQGPLKSTNNWNDVAIDGNGFFQVINHDGVVSFTRNSTLIIDPDRYLATQEGLRLADNIQVPEDFIELTIQKNGDVEVTLADDPEPQLLGTIKLAKFLNPQALTPIGSGIYNQSERTGDALIDSPGNMGLGVLVQKQIEGSNVDMVNSLMQLTLTQRVYQLNAKAVQVADELEKVINEIRD